MSTRHCAAAFSFFFFASSPLHRTSSFFPSFLGSQGQPDEGTCRQQALHRKRASERERERERGRDESWTRFVRLSGLADDGRRSTAVRGSDAAHSTVLRRAEPRHAVNGHGTSIGARPPSMGCFKTRRTKRTGLRNVLLFGRKTTSQVYSRLYCVALARMLA